MTWKWNKNMLDHPVIRGGVQARLELDEISISVVGGDGLYGDGVSTFEFGTKVGDSGNWHVAGHLSHDEVDEMVADAIKFNEWLSRLNG